MRLETVTVRNLKGLSFTFHLSPINVLIGSNFVGKTARLDAIKLCLLGFFPELGKTARATFRLCSGRELYVEGVFDNGEKLWRRWYLKGDTVKTEELIPPSLENAGDVVNVMLDADTYLGLSERERVNYVFAHIPNLDVDHDSDGIVQSLMMDLHASDELNEEALTTFSAEFKDARAAAPATTPQDFIAWAVEWAAEQEKSRKAQAVVMTKTAQGLAFLRTQDVGKEDELAAVNAAIDQGNKDLAEIRELKARASVESDNAIKTRRRRQVLAVELEGRTRQITQRDQLRAKVEKMAAEFATLPGSDAAADQALRNEDRDAVRALAGLEGDLRNVLDAIHKNEKDRAELAGKTRCAYCGATGDAWKEIKRNEIESALAGLKVKRDQLQAHLDKVRAHSVRIANDVKRANDAQYVRTRKGDELRIQRDALTALERAVASTEGKAAELAGLPVDNPKAADEHSELISRMNKKLEELGALDVKRRAIAGRQHDLKRLAEAEESRDKAAAAVVVAKAAAEALRAMQSKFVADSFAPLLEVANRFFDGILRTPLAYSEGEIGTWRDGSWVGHKTFSGAERRLSYVAIQAALAMRSPFRLMLLDEMGTIDNDNAGKVAQAIGRALADGHLDQFVGIDVGRAQIYQTESELNGTRLTLETISDPVPAS